MKCKISVSGDITFTVGLYDNKKNSFPLTLVSKQIHIFIEPTNSCINALCDLCSQESGR